MPTDYPIDADVVKINRVAGTENMWEGYEFGRPTSMYRSFEDFDRYAAGDWTITETNASATEALTNEINGVLLITNTAADDDRVTMQKVGESYLPAANKTIFFEARFKISEATQSDFLIGLVITDTTPLANSNGIYFRKDDGDTNLDFETNASSVASTDAGIHTVVADTYIKVGFKVTGTGLVEYYVNESKKGQFLVNIPITEITPTIHLQNGDGNARTASIDYIFVAQTRE